MNLNELIPTLIILITCIVTYLGFNNTLIFQRYQFHVGAILRDKQHCRLLSSGFLHVSWTHLLFNMLTLYFFYPVIVVEYGVVWFLILYFASLLLGNVLCLWLYQNRPSYAAVGASGAVSGIIFAAIALKPLMSIYLFFIPIPIPAWLFATVYFAYSVTMMLKPRQWDNTGHAAHLGGAVCGMLIVGILTPMAYVINGVYLSIMSLPLLYLAYEVLFNKKIR